MRNALILAAMAALAGCATIMEGTSQEIMVNTTPAGASCTLNREGQVIGKIYPTPGAVVVKKTKHDLIIICNKGGYEQATFINNSGSEEAAFGNILLGGGIGWAVDSANGSDNKYMSPVNITLPKK
jgi:hypothetical protein